jgi:hypothetical protein
MEERKKNTAAGQKNHVMEKYMEKKVELNLIFFYNWLIN